MKNLLKSIFISIFPLIATYFLIDGIIHLLNHGISYRYIGRITTAIGIASFFMLLFIKPVARTDANLKVYTAIVGIGFMISMIFGGIIEKAINGSFPSIGMFLGWVLYIKWYSIFENRGPNNVLSVGKVLPELILEDGTKKEVKTSSFLGNPSIFLFYRGNWCPLCMAQIKEISAQYKELEERNVNTVFISPQPHKNTKSLAKKFGLSFNFLVDTNNKVAKQLGILAKNGLPMGFQTLGYDSDTVLPTVIITDAQGKIIFSDLTDNYRVRPEPETFLKILDQN
ncbi:peroxiredoxin family protein [Aquimarina sp. D1M17]|uniref:peroxiredoxin family protein n=1 Tax=Aquimarina acroporae TaxID=2937283 RepID=UPI0020BFD249|nr:peroxiredoxin family protein [Aquimarina acroporae]MCK8523854.1 peroxiredoxin family protein [Aquimarina acroporae]